MTEVNHNSGFMVTFNHDVSELGNGDVGGPWWMERTEYDYSFGHFDNGRGFGYVGPTLPWFYNGPSLPYTGEAPADSYYWPIGAKAVAATEPTDPVANVSTFIGETMSDGLPSMVGHQTWKARTLRAKQAGGEYLNVEFGWVPLVSDIRSFAKAVHTSSKVIEQTARDSGKKIKRHLLISDDSSGEAAITDSFINTPNNSSIGSATTYTSTSLREKMWFSGCYQYYFPSGNRYDERIKRYKAYAHKLLGADLTPEVLWNISPWSWAADWKTDIGDIAHNCSALNHNGLVMQYGYVMHQQIAEIDISAGAWGRRSVATIRKRRVPANPYGFGVDQSGLSTQQIAILAALGLSRGNAKIAR